MQLDLEAITRPREDFIERYASFYDTADAGPSSTPAARAGDEAAETGAEAAETETGTQFDSPTEVAGGAQGLRQAMPGDLQHLPLEVNAELGDGVRVWYSDGRLRVEAGPDATPWHISHHVPTIRALQRYTGSLGNIRRMLSYITEFFGGGARHGSMAAEARLEIDKLTRMEADLIALRDGAGERINILGRGGFDVSEVDAEIESLRAQIEAYELELQNTQAGRGYVASGEFPRDFRSGRTVDRSATYGSEREARALVREKLGHAPVEVEPGKLRGSDGRWQYRAKPNDLTGHGPEDGPHIHLERLDPDTGEVLENWHSRW